jgi:Ca2+/Na+ antiporter
MLIIEIALGIVLGLVILRFWQEILALGAIGIAIIVAVILLLLFVYFAYSFIVDYKEEIWYLFLFVLFLAISLYVSCGLGVVFEEIEKKTKITEKVFFKFLNYDPNKSTPFNNPYEPDNSYDPVSPIKHRRSKEEIDIEYLNSNYVIRYSIYLFDRLSLGIGLLSLLLWIALALFVIYYLIKILITLFV